MRSPDNPEEPPAWKMYERLVAFVESQQDDPAPTVHPNVKLVGHLSGTERQIDTLIECRVGEDRSKRIIVDAKLHARPLDVKDVEELEGMIKDVRADRGFLVCPNGFSEAARRRVQKTISVKLLHPDELNGIILDTWNACASEECRARTSGKGRIEGWGLYDEVFDAGISDESVSPVAVGKCDVCSRFNVWCWACGQKFALESDEAEAKCCFAIGSG
ncbi:restriction endonuclease [Acidovorax sp.]|uniref:restriction endonuclease n=1 Tax=Acidovorax sp. TaxID=1872122 RepID=UPI002ACE4C0A|nr:restriction endonuclease [Acidovorax sp.]MDZ7867242.1 restriction endonuclease [Acidovorax sp.]